MNFFTPLHISLAYFSKPSELCVLVRGLCGGLVDFLSGLFLFCFFLYSVVLYAREFSYHKPIFSFKKYPLKVLSYSLSSCPFLAFLSIQ